MFKDASHYNSSADYIASLVEEIQAKHDYSQRQIAKSIGVGFTTLRDWMHNRTASNYPAQYILVSLLESDVIKSKGNDMTQLFNVLDSIVSANEFGHADTIETLSSIDDIVSYAEAANIEISDEQAERISKVGLAWINSVENGNGEWSQYRDDAKKQLN